MEHVILSAELSQPSPGYRRSAYLAITGLLAFILLYFGLAGWLLTTAWQLLTMPQYGYEGGVAHFCVAAIAFLLAIFMIKAPFGVRHATLAGLLEVKREQQPRLLDYLHQLADAAGAPRPHRVFLSNRVNAAVFYDLSLLNLIFPSKKNLEIGLPLVNSLSQGELRAVLAHEFGHFAQRSMAVGRWAYVAQQVVQEMVERRDALDRLIDGVGQLDIRLRLVAGALQMLVWSLRALVEQVFRLVLLMQRALSREMELQADLVAVSLTGSDALVHALHRLGAADDAWQRTLNFVLGEHGEGRATSDAFAVQSEITRHMADILGDPYYGEAPPLPAGQPEAHRVFKAGLGQPPKMWQTHPFSHVREENAKRRYHAAAIDGSSAWSLFDDAICLRQLMTDQLLQGQPHGAKPASMDESLRHLASIYRREQYQSRYRGVYFARSLTRHAADAAALRQARDAAPAADAGTLYPVALTDVVQELRRLREDSAQLDALLAGRIKAQRGRLEIGGEEYDSRQLPLARQQLATRIGELEEKLRQHDVRCRAWHYAVARQLGQGWPAYLDSLLDMLHYAEHTAANLNDALGLMQNKRAVVTAVKRPSEQSIRLLMADCAELHCVLDEIYRGNDKVQLDAGLAARSGVKESWQASLQKFTLAPVSRNQINEWLQSAEQWCNHTSNWLSALRASVLDQMLVCENLLASHQRDGAPIAAAPAPCAAPSGYALLLQGQERKLQTELDWRARFERADGWLPGAARLLVAGGMVAGVLGAGFMLRAVPVFVHNGLGVDVTVTVDGVEKLVIAGGHDMLDGSIGAHHKISARLKDGSVLETFEADSKGGQPVYNVAGAAPLVSYKVHYGIEGGPERTELGAPRWHISDAHIFFDSPPSSVSSRSWRKVLASAAKLEPEQQLTMIVEEPQRKALLLAHSRWDDLSLPVTRDWMIQAVRAGLSEPLAQRLQLAPDDVALRMVEQDAANESLAVCAAARQRAQAKPGDGDRLYLALRCTGNRPLDYGAVQAAVQRFPQNTRLRYMWVHLLLARSDFAAAIEPLRSLLGDGPIPVPGEELAVELERVQRLVNGNAKQETLMPGLRLVELLRSENDGPYSLLNSGQLGTVMEAVAHDPRPEGIARMQRLVGASDGATPEQVRAALDTPLDQGLDQGTLLVGAALALKYGRDVQPYWSLIRAEFKDEAPKLRAFVTAAHAGQAGAAETALGTMQFELRALAYAAGAVAAGERAPAHWRKYAGLALFGMERPYLKY